MLALIGASSSKKQFPHSKIIKSYLSQHKISVG